jgi:hypothetical protein
LQRVNNEREVDPIEQDFREALQRLLEGKPENKKLRASAKAGKLKINTFNVALEAGRSRTLIALEKCRYPAVRQAVKDAQGGKKALPTTYTQLIGNLRADIATLKTEKRLLEATMASHVLARRLAEIKGRRDAAEAARLRRQILELEKIAHLPNRDVALPRLVLIRGLPGSGKTMKAMGYVNDGYKHIEADQFFLVNGEYRFDASKLPEAHAWCLDQTRRALGEGEFVCVANVFASVEDVKPYTDLSVDYQVIEANYPGQSIHKVPKEKLRAMRATWVPTDRLVEVLRGKSGTKASVTAIASRKERR